MKKVLLILVALILLTGCKGPLTKEEYIHEVLVLSNDFPNLVNLAEAAKFEYDKNGPSQNYKDILADIEKTYNDSEKILSRLKECPQGLEDLEKSLTETKSLVDIINNKVNSQAFEDLVSDIDSFNEKLEIFSERVNYYIGTTNLKPNN